MAKTVLFDFVQVKFPLMVMPTRVIAVQGVSKRTVLDTVQAIYLTGEVGYQNFCVDCKALAMCQETGSPIVPIKIFCSVEKCLK